MSLTQSAPPLRVLIAKDAVLLREGLRRLLTDTGLDVAGRTQWGKGSISSSCRSSSSSWHPR